MEKREPSYPADGNPHWCSYHGEQCGGSSKKLKTGLRLDPGVPPRTARGEQDSTRESHPGQPEESRTRTDARPGTHTSTLHGSQDRGAAECPSAEERQRGHGARTTDRQCRGGGTAPSRPTRMDQRRPHSRVKSDRENKSHMLSFISRIQNMTEELIYEVETDSQTHHRQTCGCQGVGVGKGWTGSRGSAGAHCYGVNEARSPAAALNALWPR